MRRVRVEHEGGPVSGTLSDGVIELESGGRIEESEASWLAPLEPGKILAAHLTYRSRCDEYAMSAPPDTPSYFVKPPNTVSHHGADVARPAGCSYLNYEGEIAVVIGRTASNVTVDEALEYVAGYTVVNDWGVHDFRHADRGSMLRVKGQDGFCPIGPAMVDATDVDPTDLTIRTFVNGELAQEGHTGDDLIFSFAYQVADIARLLTLEPGDVILTGTPPGVGGFRNPPIFLQDGDLVTVAVEGIGELTNPVRHV